MPCHCAQGVLGVDEERTLQRCLYSVVLCCLQSFVCGTALASEQRPVTCEAQLRLAGFMLAWGSAASLPTCLAWFAMGRSQGVVRYLMANTLQ